MKAVTESLIHYFGFTDCIWSPSKLTDKLRTCDPWEGAAARYAKTKHAWRWYHVLAPVAFILVVDGCLHIRNANEQAEKARQDAQSKVDEEWRAGDRLTENIKVSYSAGPLTTDLMLVNSQPPDLKEVTPVRTSNEPLPPATKPLREPRPLTRCDLTITVHFDTGTTLPIQRSWDQWLVAETKKVNIPSRGRIQKVELNGTVHDWAGSTFGRVSQSYSFRPDQ